MVSKNTMRLPLHKYSYLAFLVFPLLFTPVFVHAFVQEMMWDLVVGFFGRFVALFGLMLDYAVKEFVIDFGTNFNTSGVGLVIDRTWISVRDIFNMTFIFGLVYIGFKMILNSDDSNTKKLLINLILAALLVNFSLFLTKAVVEVSNVLATEIAQTGFYIAQDGYPSISATFANHTGINTIYGIDDLKERVSYGGAWGYILGSAILFMVTIFVFATGAFMLMVRYAALLLYMVFSPFMFIGWVFPQLQKYTNDYWSGFLGRAFFAPIYILMVYLSLKIIGNFYADSTSVNGESALGDAVGGGGQVTVDSFEASLPPFVVSIIFMLAAVVISSKMSADGAKGAIKIGNKIRNKAGQYTRRAAKGTVRVGARAGVGLAAATTRRSVGRIGNAVANNEKMKKWAGGNKLGVGRLAMKASQATAKASFDPRNVAGVGKKLGIGSGKTGGYKKTIEDATKKKTDFGDTLEADMTDPENIKAVEQKIPEIKQEKLNQAQAATTQAKTVNDDKRKSASVINDEVAELQSEVDASTKALKTLEADDTKSPSEIAALQKDIDTKTATIATKKRVSTSSEKREGINNKYQAAYSAAETALDGSPEKAAAEVAMKEARSELNAVDGEIDDISREFASQAATLTQDASRAREFATAQVQFGNQIEYMKQLENDANQWGNLKSKFAGALGGSSLAGLAGVSLGIAATATTAGVVGAAGALGVGAVTTQSRVSNLARQNMLKKYGADGMKGAQSKASEKSLNNLLEQIKKEGSFDTKEVAPQAPRPAPPTDTETTT